MPRRRPDRTVASGPQRRRSAPKGAELGGGRVEGRRAVRELLAVGKRRVLSVTMSEHLDRASVLDEILALANASGVPVDRVDPEAFRQLAETSAPQGVIAEAEPLVPVQLEELAGGGRAVPFLVVLSEVSDPQNVGAIFRSALGAGATGVVLGRHRGGRLSPAAVKAAAGAVEHLPVALVGGIPQALSNLARAGVWVVGLDPEGEATASSLTVADQPLALVVGSEGAGLSPLVKARCAERCRIPLYGPVGSLNASVAAGVALFALAERRAEAGLGPSR